MPRRPLDGARVRSPFELVFEIAPPTRPDLASVGRQVSALAPVGRSFLVPDNHLGRATVSSIAVAHAVAAMGADAVACVNSRDRNRLGFQRDLLTAAAYGVRRLLCVAGDRRDTAGAGDLTVRHMLADARAFDEEHAALLAETRFSLGVTSRLAPLPTWKHEADFLLVQATFDLGALLSWREALDFAGRVYAGVIVIASPAMAKALADATDEIRVPEELLARVATEPDAGVQAAVCLIDEIRSSGAFDGAHVIPVSRYRALASGLVAAGFNATTGEEH